jgi:hypothetical protein
MLAVFLPLFASSAAALPKCSFKEKTTGTNCFCQLKLEAFVFYCPTCVLSSFCARIARKASSGENTKRGVRTLGSTFDPAFKNDLEQSESCRARQDLPVRAVRASFTLSMFNEKFIDN